MDDLRQELTMTMFSFEELNRLVKKIPETDPTTQEYSILLHNIEQYAIMMDKIDWILMLTKKEEVEDVKEETSEIIPFTPPVREEEKFDKDSSDEQTGAEDTGASGDGEAATETDADTQYEISDVRKALSTAKAAGKLGSPKAWIKDNVGCDGLEAIPVAKYGEVIQKLEALL